MEKIKEMLETIEKHGDKIKIEDQFRYVFNNEKEDWLDMIKEAEKENIKAQGLEDDLDYLYELKEKYEDEMIKYFRENLATKRLEEIKNRIDKKGLKYFEVETEEIGNATIGIEDESNDFTEIINCYTNALIRAEIELRGIRYNKRVKLVRLVGYVSKDQEVFDDDNMEILINQEVRKVEY